MEDKSYYTNNKIRHFWTPAYSRFVLITKQISYDNKLHAIMTVIGIVIYAAGNLCRNTHLFQITWPFNCAHASLTFNEGQLMMNVQAFDCCEKCRFPAFTGCVAAGNSNVCIGRGLRCINRCIDVHLRPCGASTIGENWSRHGKSSKQRCPSKVKKTGQSYCIQRSCIPLNI